MTEYKLHCFYNSGNAFKVAMMLDVAGCDWRAVEVTPGGDAVHDAAWWAQANGFGEVPVLERGGRFHSQSGLILHHLARETGRFGPRDAAQAAEIWRWILFDNHKFTGNFSMLRFQCAIAKTGETEITAYLRARVRRAWDLVNRHLADRAFLLGDYPTVADFSLAGYLYYGEETGIDRAAEFPGIEAWTHRIAALPGWRSPQDVLPGR
ncbi:MAG: glutathione S-transferase [Alphaproteobacteria bacterium]|jgi:glutathione S-transferase